MRPYAIYEHPDFSVSSSDSKFTLQKVATILTFVVVSGVAVYGLILRKGGVSLPFNDFLPSL